MSLEPKISKDFFGPNSSVSLNTSYLWRRLQKTYKQHKLKPLPPTYRSRLSGPSASWKVFKHLKEACSYADSKTTDCMIFSFEERIPTSTGQRLFLVTHPQQMWLNHKLRPLKERCTYEVIREGCPCKLYFDLEFSISCNPGKNGNEMTKIFSKCVIALMLEKYNLKLQPFDFLWLDSSSEEKFSCHLILQIQNIAFQNNIETGKFVKLLTYNILKRLEVDAGPERFWPLAEDLRTLIIQNKCGEKTLFCDEGVYTKNRNFRLYFSTKFRKNVPLVLSTFNQYEPAATKNSCKEENLFYDSLITYFRTGNNFEKLLVCDFDNVIGNQSSLIHQRRNINSSGITGNASSLCPELDSFILNLIKDDSIIGFVRKWTFLTKEQIIIYDIGNYRFCGNIGRHHKSNNIMIVVDIKSKTYYQKCHDPVCKSEKYRSQAFPLPENVSLFDVPEDFFDCASFSQLANIEEDHEISASTKSDACKMINSFDSCSFDSSLKVNIKPQIDSSVENSADQKKDSLHPLIIYPDFSEKNYDCKSMERTASNEKNFICNSDVSTLHCLSAFNVSQKTNSSLIPHLNVKSVDKGCNFDSSFQAEKVDSVSEDLLCSSKVDEEFSCADISAEEEMMIAEITAVVEASLNENSIFEEIIL